MGRFAQRAARLQAGRRVENVPRLYFCALDASITSEADGAMNNEIQFEAWYGRFTRLGAGLYPGRYSREYVRDLVETAKEITALARRKGPLIVAHNHVYLELQEVAEAVGNSLGLSLLVAKRRAPRVDFCGVWFMGETAKMILGDRSKVFMPDRLLSGSYDRPSPHYRLDRTAPRRGGGGLREYGRPHESDEPLLMHLGKRSASAGTRAP